MTTSSASLDEALGERQHLLNLAFRMLGTRADAEDVVQETYTRWVRLSDAERAAIRAPRGWLVRVASNACLDLLGSARHRREQYTGEWLPEPLPHSPVHSVATDPLDRVTLDDSVTMALLVVLETLSPAERVAFVLHDVFELPFDEIAEIVGRTPQACRKLASTARRHVSERRRREASTERHDSVVQAFVAACATGDFAALLAALDPEVTARADGGGKVSAALRPILGPDKVSRYLLGSLAKSEGLEISLEPVSGLTGIVIRREGVVGWVVSLNVTDTGITNIWIVMTPDKLELWNRG